MNDILLFGGATKMNEFLKYIGKYKTMKNI